MHPTRHVRAAVAGVALSAVVALGMAGAAYAQESPELSCENVGDVPPELVWAMFNRLETDAERRLLDPEKTGRPCGLEPLQSTGGTTSATTSPSTSPTTSPTTGGDGGSTAKGSNTDRDCPDFKSQAEAQAAFDADKSDPERLDADDDEIACEDHFKTEDDQVAVKPKGGVATGGDGR